MSKYKIIRKNEFAVSLMQVSRDSKIPVARLEDYEVAIMSPAYPIFRVKDTRKILPEYLDMWFKRPEFDREAAFIAVGGVRGSMPWEEFVKMKLPVPTIEKQLEIVNSYKAITERIALKQKINDNLEAQAEAIYNEMIANNSTNGTMSTLGEISTIKTGKLNSEAAVINGIYPFFTCSQETYRTNTFSFDQEAVLLAGNNASAIYPLKIYCGKFDVYQRTYVISSNNRFVSNKQLYFVLKQQLNEFKGISSGTTTKFLTMKILTPIPVVIAPEDIATSFINITNKIFETIFQNQREIEHLRELQMIVLGELSRD
ncbi:restriction endonuclease subunit S [Faecalibacillus faecis]|uniref:restriction endonuclease subunit S n=1 Tax=Faecalibacillus faecis TaxID=1982628 RepID=UPI0018AA27B6|nr:restriction endonuclease subunit S [Faecalibacillus faecis]